MTQRADRIAILPVIKGVKCDTELLTQIRKRLDIQVSNKPTKTLQDFPVPTFRIPKDNKCTVMYKIILIFGSRSHNW